MKSRIALSQPHRPFTLAGLLALGILALPEAGHAQAPEAERALLNKTGTPSVSETTAGPSVDGARALLGQAGASARQVFPPAGGSRLTLGDAYRIEGARALLGRAFGPSTTHANAALRH